MVRDQCAQRCDSENKHSTLLAKRAQRCGSDSADSNVRAVAGLKFREGICPPPLPDACYEPANHCTVVKKILLSN